jgi:hypothetical protein
LADTNSSTSSHVVSDCVFGATAIITLGALYFIYRRMLGVRKKVLVGMRKDLQAHHIDVTEPNPDSNFARAGNDERNWSNPWAQNAVTNPKGPQYAPTNVQA